MSLSKAQRSIKAETMTAVMKYSPKDGFKLTDNILNKIYTITAIEEFDFSKTLAFSVTMESETGEVITLSGSALKRARLMKDVAVKDPKYYEDSKDVFLRSNADFIWNASSYFHSAMGMKKDQDFEMPAKIKLRYAILNEDQDTGEPMLNPYLFKEFRKVVKSYGKREEYPTMDDFREELLKSKEDGRLSFLPVSYMTPEPYSWVKKELSDFRHTLVIQAVK